MLGLAADAAAGAGLLTASFLYGMRHGIDVDHLAAIADITGVPDRPRRSLWLASLYAAGHGAVLLGLGGVAIMLGRSIPSGLDNVMQRVVGGTLIALGLYLGYQLLRDPRNLRLRSRWDLVVSMARAVTARRGGGSEIVVIEHSHEHAHDHDRDHHDHEHEPVAAYAGGPPGDSPASRARETHSHPHVHLGTVPPDPFEGRTAAALTTGAIHGVGAETPTQILVFATAAGATSAQSGLVILIAFVAGLFLANSLVAIGCIAGFTGSKRAPIVYIGLAVVTAILSVIVGSFYVIGRGDFLARLFAG